MPALGVDRRDRQYMIRISCAHVGYDEGRMWSGSSSGRLGACPPHDQVGAHGHVMLRRATWAAQPPIGDR